MAKKNSLTHEARQIWSSNLAPLMVAARQGASHTTGTARKELAKARRRRPWWRSRWMAVTVTGLAAAGVAGTVAAMASRRDELGQLDSHPTHDGDEASAGLRSTVEAGRDRMGDLTRTMWHRFRANGELPTVATEAPDAMAAAPEAVSTTPEAMAVLHDERRN